MNQNIIKFTFNQDHPNKIYCVSEKNSFAYKLINAWPKWSNNILYIYGPKNCGKSLISSIWKKKTNAKIIDFKFFNHLEKFIHKNSFFDQKCWIIENFDFIINKNSQNIEEKVLNFINLLSKSSYVLITSKIAPNKGSFNLKDLSSRLNASIVIEIKEPDEALLKKILKKHFELRQISIQEKQINFLINRMERTYTSAFKIIKLIDEISLIKQSKISNSLLRDVLSKFEKNGL